MADHDKERWTVSPPLAVMLIGLVAAAVRLWSPQTVFFSLDEANLISGIQKVLAGHWPAFGDTSSWGIRNPPLLFYVLSVPYMFGGPAGVVVALALGNATAVALTAWLCLRYLGLGPGVLAGLAYAASPWTIFFGRQPWTEVNQLLQALAIVAATRVMLGGAGWWAAVAILAVALNGLGYLLGDLLWTSLLLAVILSPRRWLNRWSAAAAVATAALAFPYLSVIAPEIGRLPELALQRGRPFDVSELPRALHLLRLYLGGANLEAILGGPAAASFPLKDLLSALSYVALAAFGAGLAVLALGAHSPASGLRRAWLGWSLPPLALLLFQPRPEVIRYETVLMPLPFLWLAALFAVVWRHTRARRALVAGVVSVSAVWLVGWGLIVTRMGSLPGSQGRITLGQWLSLGESIPADTAGRLFAVARGSSPNYAGEPAAIAALLSRGRPVAFLDGTIGLLRARPTVYIVTSTMPEPAWGGEPLPGVREAGSSPAGRILIVPPAASVRLPAGVVSLDPPVQFSDGPELRGYRVSRQQRAIELTTFWRMGEVSPRAVSPGLTMFNHVLDDAGSRVAQVDGFGLPSDMWEAGQWLAQTYRAPIAPDRAQQARTVFAGIYSRGDGPRSQVLDPRKGQPADGVWLPIPR